MRSPLCASSLDGFGNACGNPRKRSKCWDINAENDKNDEEPRNWGEYPSAGSFSHLAQHINPKTYRYVTQKSFLYVGRKRPGFKQDSTHRFRSRPFQNSSKCIMCRSTPWGWIPPPEGSVTHHRRRTSQGPKDARIDGRSSRVKEGSVHGQALVNLKLQGSTFSFRRGPKASLFRPTTKHTGRGLSIIAILQE